jgi:hypothetical protein
MRKVLILLGHAFVVWGLCAAVMGISMSSTTLERALIIHAAAAPLIAFTISSFYYWKFYYTQPLQTAIVFVSFVIFMDVFLVAIVIIKSFDMFRSIIGTWLPFILIFTVTYLTGVIWKKTKS